MATQYRNVTDSRTDRLTPHNCTGRAYAQHGAAIWSQAPGVWIYNTLQQLSGTQWLNSKIREYIRFGTLIIIIVFIEIKLTIATCYNDTPNKLPLRTALHCITEHKALTRRPSSQPNITQV